MNDLIFTGREEHLTQGQQIKPDSLIKNNAEKWKS